jgi:HAD superfamily hydrolase (TIGR01484 family)
MNKRLFVFDLDGTLAESKSTLTVDMSALLSKLMQVGGVAIISGGAFPQFEKQILPHLANDDRLDNLSLLPTCGTKFFRHRAREWTCLYSEDFSQAEAQTIIDALNKAFEQSGFKPQKQWGELIENRGGQVTLSALGQEAPLDAKKAWDPDFEKRKKIKAILEPMIPQFSVQLGGATSMDITRPGVDKAYGIRKLRDVLGVPIDQMLFFGDALFPGGNDYPAQEAGAQSIRVRDPQETQRIIEAIVACWAPLQ